MADFIEIKERIEKMFEEYGIIIDDYDREEGRYNRINNHPMGCIRIWYEDTTRKIQ